MRFAAALVAITLSSNVSWSQIKVVGPEVGQINNQYIVKVEELKGTDLKIKYLKDGQEQKSPLNADFIQLKDNDDKPVIVVFTRNPGVYSFIFATATTNGKADLYIHTLTITNPKPNPNPKPIDPPINSEYETKLTQSLASKPTADVQALLVAWQKTEPSKYNSNLDFLTALKMNTDTEMGVNGFAKAREARDTIGTYLKSKYSNPSAYDLTSLNADWELTTKIIKQSLGQ